MKIFIAGATGALGKRLVPLLVAEGHEVTGATTTESKLSVLQEQGAEGVLLDVLDHAAVTAAVMRAEPEVVVHEATSLSSMGANMRSLDREFALTNRLRTEGTDHLLAAGRAVGVKRFVAQSYAGWPVARTGPAVKTEDDPFDPAPAAPMREALDAIRYLERTVVGAEWTEGIALRYGGFYGPGTSISADGEHVEMIRRRKFPIVGNGGGVWSFVHIGDAADATVAAVERGRRGVYNIVDDEPAPVAEWLPEAAATFGAKPPRHVPRWLGRALAGEAAAVMMTEVRGASNDKAKRELGWQPAHASWREGFAEAVAA
jgi:nucleoside-diphosphate-sugar epimerase